VICVSKSEAKEKPSDASFLCSETVSARASCRTLLDHRQAFLHARAEVRQAQDVAHTMLRVKHMHTAAFHRNLYEL